jgi:hypothetical protein
MRCNPLVIKAEVASMKRLLFALLLLAYAVPMSANADVPSQLQAGGGHVPPQVNNVVATRSGSGKVTLTWNMMAFGGYHITSVTIHRTVGNANPKSVTLGVVRQWSDHDVSQGTTYEYAICAHDSGQKAGCGYTHYTPGGSQGP